MFGGLKKKLKGALGIFSKKVEEEAEEVEEEIVEEPVVEKKPVEKKTPPKEKLKEEKPDSKKEVKEEPKKEEKEPVKEKIPEPEKVKPEGEEKVKPKEVPKEVPKESPKPAPERKSEPVLEEKPVEKKVESDPIEEPVVEEEKTEPVVEKKEEPVEEKVHDISEEVEVIDQKAVQAIEDEKAALDEEQELEREVAEAPDEFKEEVSAVKDIEEASLEKEKLVAEKAFEEIEEEKAEETKKGFFGKIFSKKKKDAAEEFLEEDTAKSDVEEEKEDLVIEERDEPVEKETAEPTKEIIEDTVKEPVETAEEPKEIIESEDSEDVEEEPKKKSFFGKVREGLTKKVSAEKFEELFWDIEVVLLENNVSLEVVEKIKDDLQQAMVGKPIPKSQILNIILKSLRKSITELFDVPSIDLIKKTEEKKPLVISFVGVNGSGKTTNLAKVAKKFQDAGKTCVIAACDTFRAAAIQQLEEHANNLGIKIIKHDYGADSAAVAFDAIEHAKSKNIDVVLLDTAGRLHSNENLMKELEKLVRVADPDINIFVGESITGNDCVEQAKTWSEYVRLDGIILSKADVDDKGGAAISISYITGKPILYLGVGQGYDDLQEFDSGIILESLEL